MRQTAEILKELGFNEDAPESTKRALLRHIERAAGVEKSTLCPVIPLVPRKSAPEQLSFDFSALEAPSEKASTQK